MLSVKKVPTDWVITGGRGINILVIDSHIDTSSSIYKDKVIYLKELNFQCGYSTSHCDSVCKIISYVAPLCKIGVYQILRNKTSDIFGLKIALRDVMNLDFDIINLSMATSKDDQELKNLIRDLSKTKLIVSSVSNIKMQSYPADYPEVLSVASFANSDMEADLYCSDRLGITDKTGNSMATAFISGVCALAKSYDKGITKDLIKLQLQK